MKKLFIFLSIIATLSSSAQTWVDDNLRSGLASWNTVPVLIYLPKSYNDGTNKSLPVVLMNPGSGEAADIRNDASMKVNSFGKLIAGGQVPQAYGHEFIMVFLQQVLGNYNRTSVAKYLLADLKARYRVDSNCVNLAGLSLGSEAPWSVFRDTTVANQFSFNYVMAPTGYLNAGDQANVPNIKVPTVILYGSADTCNAPWQCTDAAYYANQLKQLNPSFTLVRLVNATHGGSTWDVGGDTASRIFNGQNIYELMWNNRKQQPIPQIPTPSALSVVAEYPFTITVTIQVMSDGTTRIKQ